MLSEQDLERLRDLARKMRVDIVNMLGTKTTGHLGGAASCVEILAALYFYKMRHDPKNPKMEDRDRLILSKGHAALAQYVALARAGYFPAEELASFKELGSKLQGHPDCNKTPGIEACTGSLGQGLSIGLGMALGGKLDNRPFRVYVLLGDGELYEGQVWEAAIACAAYRLDNLVAIVDANGFAVTGKIAELLPNGNLREKFRAFGWHVAEVDGHDMRVLAETLDGFDAVAGQPKMIIANTIKGKGYSFAENVASFHNTQLTKELYQRALQELAG